MSLNEQREATSIPLLGLEQITCDVCLDRLVESGAFDG